MKRIGIVVQRYGAEVVGGSEQLARDISQRLHRYGRDVHVYTTCARDYISWRNHYPPGESVLKGVAIHRFPVESIRKIEDFNRYSRDFFQSPSHSLKEEEEWIDRQGPRCPSLLKALRRDEALTDLFIFFTYLYYPVVRGIPRIQTPCLLFPTAHDEPPFHLQVMKPVFRSPRKLLFLTEAERDLVHRHHKLPEDRLVVTRTGMMAGEGKPELFRTRFRQFFPYILYAGRIEKGKGLDMAFGAFRELKKRQLVELVLIGKKLMEIPDTEGIRYMGFVSQEEKESAFRDALFSLQPSSLESLSITTLESFFQGTPVLANGKSPVLCEHVNRSGGGYTYQDTGEFLHHAEELCRRPSLRRRLGGKGRQYVGEFFSWDRVIGTLNRTIDEVLGS